MSVKLTGYDALRSVNLNRSGLKVFGRRYTSRQRGQNRQHDNGFGDKCFCQSALNNDPPSASKFDPPWS